MTERVSSDASRNVCRRPEDDEASQVSNEKPAPAPVSRDRLVSAPPPDWDRVPNSCEENAAMAAKNATPIGPPLPPKGAGASTNAARTTERDAGMGPYAAAGRTHDGHNAFVAVAAVKGKTSAGNEVEAVSISGQVGRQNEIQVAALRLGSTAENGSGAFELGTANAHVGIENSDGSVGLNVGASATIKSAEMTIKHEGSSATLGLSHGVGAEAHVGVRDDDRDGQPEICLRFAAGFAIAGACYEIPLFIRP